MEVIQIKIEDLIEHPDNQTLLPPLSKDDEAELRNSLLGFIKPIPMEVLRHNGKLVVLDGNNRLRILKDMNFTGTFPVIILGQTQDWPIEKQRTTIQKINLARRHMSMEQKKEIARQMVARGEALRDVANVVGLAKDTVAKVAKEEMAARQETIKEVVATMVDAGLSTREIEKAVGVSQKTVSNLSQNRTKYSPSAEILSKSGSPLPPPESSVADLVAQGKMKLDEKNIMAKAKEARQRESARVKEKQARIEEENKKLVGTTKFQVVICNKSLPNIIPQLTKEFIDSILAENAVIFIGCFARELPRAFKILDATGLTLENVIPLRWQPITYEQDCNFNRFFVMGRKGHLDRKLPPIKDDFYKMLECWFPTATKFLMFQQNPNEGHFSVSFNSVPGANWASICLEDE